MREPGGMTAMRLSRRRLRANNVPNARVLTLTTAPVVVAAAVLGWLLGSAGLRNGQDAVRGAGVATPEEADAAASTPTAEGPSADDSGESSVERWIRVATSVIAPTTVLTALLFYFGYVETTAEYRYFGITLGTLGLTTQDLVLRSVAALYVPLGALLVLLLAMTWVHHTVSRRLAAGSSTTALRRWGVVLMLLGAAAFARGVVGIIVPEVARTEPVAVSPMSLALGTIAAAYGANLWRRTAPDRGDLRATAWSRRATLAFTAGLITLSLFWATNSFAAAYGRGRAVEVASRLQEDRPRVTLDTTERLFVISPDDSLGVEEAALPPEDGQRFRYRYTGLRLLVEAQGRMFLLPDRWNIDAGYTLVISVGDDVRFLVYR
jgi:hypothetical protein